MSELGSLSGRKPIAEKLVPLAGRPTTLKGRTVALYLNDKVASYPVMRTIKDLLGPLDVKKVFEVHSQTPYSLHPEKAIQEALKADVVFVGTGD